MNTPIRARTDDNYAEPATPLGFHRVLAPVAGVRCSPLCLGAMNFGDAWKEFMGECNKETTFEILDYFYQNGGNVSFSLAGESSLFVGVARD